MFANTFQKGVQQHILVISSYIVAPIINYLVRSIMDQVLHMLLRFLGILSFGTVSDWSANASQQILS